MSTAQTCSVSPFIVRQTKVTAESPVENSSEMKINNATNRAAATAATTTTDPTIRKKKNKTKNLFTKMLLKSAKDADDHIEIDAGGNDDDREHDDDNSDSDGAAGGNGGNGEDDADSSDSMETLSDNVAIWVDGEKHWISGVDAMTTCADLICALIAYQSGEQETTAAAAANTSEAGGTAARRPPGHASEFVIVKQHRHCEEYLDGGTKVFDVATPGGGGGDKSSTKQCDLLLRRLVSASPPIGTQVSSMLSTDKDSGMGSPVGSSRSARFRRRRHKFAAVTTAAEETATTAATAAATTTSMAKPTTIGSSTFRRALASGNTPHPKLSHRSAIAAGDRVLESGGMAIADEMGSGAERLMAIIRDQDETIHRQLSLLREKERQITKIEEEKHRIRERELGKNYLLETYLNGLDEADTGADREVANDGGYGGDGIEIFIDEPYQRYTAGEALSPPHHPQDTEHGSPSVIIAAAVDIDADPTDIDLQILWLEKIYALNRQLQREEEMLLKLHAKVRKHQVKRAYQTKREVLQQIDRMDEELARQCADIYRIEDSLMASNEQLREKLGVLEELSQEFIGSRTVIRGKDDRMQQPAKAEQPPAVVRSSVGPPMGLAQSAAASSSLTTTASATATSASAMQCPMIISISQPQVPDHTPQQRLPMAMSVHVVQDQQSDFCYHHLTEQESQHNYASNHLQPQQPPLAPSQHRRSMLTTSTSHSPTMQYNNNSSGSSSCSISNANTNNYNIANEHKTKMLTKQMFDGGSKSIIDENRNHHLVNDARMDINDVGNGNNQWNCRNSNNNNNNNNNFMNIQNSPHAASQRTMLMATTTSMATTSATATATATASSSSSSSSASASASHALDPCTDITRLGTLV